MVNTVDYETLLAFFFIICLLCLLSISGILKYPTSKTKKVYNEPSKDFYKDDTFWYVDLVHEISLINDSRRYFFKIPIFEKYYSTLSRKNIVEDDKFLSTMFSVYVGSYGSCVCVVERNLAYRWEEITPFLYDFFIDSCIEFNISNKLKEQELKEKELIYE